jgi:1,4-alpha-glucan branching enzyme
MVYKRKGKKPKDDVLVVLNMTPVIRENWEVHVQGKSKWQELFNSDDKQFWGSGNVSNPDIEVTPTDKKEKWYKLSLNLPPLGAVILR